MSSLGRTGLVRLSTAFTFLGFLPSVFSLIYGGWSRRLQGSRRIADDDAQCPTVPLLPYALFTCSMSFFLFSFQVHEKSVLLPLLPLTIILSSATPGSVTWDWAVLVNNVAMFR
jgi:alpha-1,3-glucosyltransferase